MNVKIVLTDSSIYIILNKIYSDKIKKMIDMYHYFIVLGIINKTIYNTFVFFLVWKKKKCLPNEASLSVIFSSNHSPIVLLTGDFQPPPPSLFIFLFESLLTKGLRVKDRDIMLLWYAICINRSHQKQNTIMKFQLCE